MTRIKPIVLTSSHKNGTNINAIPAGTFAAPTPIFLIMVGYSSAVYIGSMAFDELMQNLLAIMNVVISHCRSLEIQETGMAKAANIPERIMVAARGHLRPPFIKMSILRATAGNSTTPINIYKKIIY